ncbi:sulfatase [Algoriphagus sp. CAU 1675]|uniref:sulfatase n=1 Tax=Algoriphagus sp. CAU 1675 TaxID=3032597 RepID=UPI0023DB426B|nr:sulfatase [Algoriphagus sp. CAU 1675]MDF2159014.1 sulfatase [Algoriphagus sp. CAU 1675]
MRTLLSITICSLFLGCFEETKAQTNSSPNVVFFLVDDLGWTDLGSFGSEFYETPNLDKLVNSGIKFTQAYTASPVCSPTRASIMTGKYPSKIYNTDWFGAPQPDEIQGHWTRNKPLKPATYDPNLSLDEITLAEAFKSVGYKTFFAGKWHLGEEESHWPENQGFDFNKGGNNKGAPSSGNKYFSPYDNPRLENGPEGEYLPERLAMETVRFIRDNKDAPFFAMLSFYSVHTPLMTKPELEKKYLDKKVSLRLEDKFGPEGNNQARMTQSHAIYAGMVEAMDQAVGRVIDEIEVSGLRENTIFVFFSDNGGLSTAEGSPTSNLPLKAGKGWLYEGGIRVPMILSWKGQLVEGKEIHTPVISNDIFPTLLDLSGNPQVLDSIEDLDGKSLKSWVFNTEEKKIREPLFWHYPHYGNQGGSPGSVIREGDWKLIYFYENQKSELYNLKEDIGEQNNLVDSRADLAEEMKNKLFQWLISTKAGLPRPNEDYDPSK